MREIGVFNYLHAMDPSIAIQIRQYHGSEELLNMLDEKDRSYLEGLMLRTGISGVTFGEFLHGFTPDKIDKRDKIDVYRKNVELLVKTWILTSDMRRGLKEAKGQSIEDIKPENFIYSYRRDGVFFIDLDQAESYKFNRFMHNLLVYLGDLGDHDHAKTGLDFIDKRRVKIINRDNIRNVLVQGFVNVAGEEQAREFFRYFLTSVSRRSLEGLIVSTALEELDKIIAPTTLASNQSLSNNIEINLSSAGDVKELQRLALLVSTEYQREEVFKEQGGYIFGREENGKYIITRFVPFENPATREDYLEPGVEDITKSLLTYARGGIKLIGAYHNHSFARLVSNQRPGPSATLDFDFLNFIKKEAIGIAGTESVAEELIGLVIEPRLNQDRFLELVRKDPDTAFDLYKPTIDEVMIYPYLIHNEEQVTLDPVQFQQTIFRVDPKTQINREALRSVRLIDDGSNPSEKLFVSSEKKTLSSRGAEQIQIYGERIDGTEFSEEYSIILKSLVSGLPEDIKIILVEHNRGSPDSAERKLLFYDEPANGPIRWIFSHAGTRKQTGKFIYLPKLAFLELSKHSSGREFLKNLIRDEIDHATAKFEGRWSEDYHKEKDTKLRDFVREYLGWRLYPRDIRQLIHKIDSITEEIQKLSGLIADIDRVLIRIRAIKPIKERDTAIAEIIESLRGIEAGLNGSVRPEKKAALAIISSVREDISSGNFDYALSRLGTGKDGARVQLNRYLNTIFGHRTRLEVTLREKGIYLLIEKWRHEGEKQQTEIVVPKFYWASRVPLRARRYISKVISEGVLGADILEAHGSVKIDYIGDGTAEDWFLKLSLDELSRDPDTGKRLYHIPGPELLFRELAALSRGTQAYFKALWKKNKRQVLAIYNGYQQRLILHRHVWARERQIYSITWEDSQGNKHSEKWALLKDVLRNKPIAFIRDVPKEGIQQTLASNENLRAASSEHIELAGLLLWEWGHKSSKFKLINETKKAFRKLYRLYFGYEFSKEDKFRYINKVINRLAMLLKYKLSKGYAITLAGVPTASGKTTLMKKAAEIHPESFVVIGLDRYFKSKIERDIGNGVHDFDSPNAYDWEALRRDLAAIIINGEGHINGEYDFAKGAPRIKEEEKEYIKIDLNRQMLVIEGIYALDRRIIKICEDALARSKTRQNNNKLKIYKIYLYASPLLRIVRRVIRDVTERDCNPLETIISWFRKGGIRDMEDKHILPTTLNSDIRVGTETPYELNRLAEEFESLLRSKTYQDFLKENGISSQQFEEKYGLSEKNVEEIIKTLIDLAKKPRLFTRGRDTKTIFDLYNAVRMEKKKTKSASQKPRISIIEKIKGASFKIETLKAKDLEEALAVHNETWGDNFRLTLEDVERILKNNKNGHLVARNEKGEIVGVVWCASLFSETIDKIPGSLKEIMLIKKSMGDNRWLHYAVAVRADYQKKGLGPQIAASLLHATEPLSEGMGRYTYSPLSGYGKHKHEMSPMSYLIQSRPSSNEAVSKGAEAYLDFKEDNRASFREYLERRGRSPTSITWEDYEGFKEEGGMPLEDYVLKYHRSLISTAANMHVKNGARIVRIIPGGREGDKDAGEAAIITEYREFPAVSLPAENQEAYLDFVRRMTSLITQVETDMISHGLKETNFATDSFNELYAFYKKIEPLFVYMHQAGKQGFNFGLSKALLKVIRLSMPVFDAHTIRVQKLAKKVIDQLVSQGAEISKDTRLQIIRAARLHDLGKLFFTESIFSGTIPSSSLDEPHHRIINMHPVWGSMILELFPGFKDIVPLVKYHHERMDGSGYPSGLKGDAIPFGTRLISVLDVFDAMTEHRDYEKRKSIGEAFEYLKENSGILFDAQVVDALIAVYNKNQKDNAPVFSPAMEELRNTNGHNAQTSI